MVAKVAVIGAGLCGLTAGRLLQETGVSVEMFDKGRGPGGRMASRRRGEGALDHGAQYFTARDPRFREQVEKWAAAGVVAPWQGRLGVLKAGAFTPQQDGPRRYVGVPRMSAVGRHWGQGLAVLPQTRIVSLSRRTDGWQLEDDQGHTWGGYGAVLVTLPPPQALELLGPDTPFSPVLKQVEMRPCWALMAAFEPRLETPYDGAFVHGSPLSWVARDSSKPGRPAADHWVIHAGTEWSEQHLEAAAAEVVAPLLRAFWQASGYPPVAAAWTQAHRWRYSIAAQALDQGCLADGDLRLAVGGDWCQGSRVEGAYLSGVSAAEILTRWLD